ncbi:MAG: hypothetical protein R3F13_01315 [Prosthecobacter sp.]
MSSPRMKEAQVGSLTKNQNSPHGIVDGELVAEVAEVEPALHDAIGHEFENLQPFHLLQVQAEVRP